MKARVVFMGSPRFAVPILEALLAKHEVVGVVTRPDRPAGRGRKLTPPPVKEVALAGGVPLLQPRKLRGNEEALSWLRERNPDVIVVAAYGLILPPAVLKLPPHGCLNVHASLLPRHRGAAPIPAAILAGDRETGVSIILMDEGLDTGPILAQKAILIAPDDTTASLSEKLSRLGAELLLEVLPLWLEGKVTPRPQQGEPSYAPMLKKEDGLIDWSLPAVEIERRVRAYDPWPGAYTFWDGRILKIWRAEVSEARPDDLPPGAVFQDSEGVKVACGRGSLRLVEIQLEGRKRMPAGPFCCGRPDFVGTVLGR